VTYAHIWIMGWCQVVSGLALTLIRTMVPMRLNTGALHSVSGSVGPWGDVDEVIWILKSSGKDGV